MFILAACSAGDNALPGPEATEVFSSSPGASATSTPSPTAAPRESGPTSKTPTPESTAPSGPTSSSKGELREKEAKGAEPVAPQSQCDPNYGSACVPISSLDLDCPQVAQMVIVIGEDIHRFDADGDGRGCESYG
ncbi:MAG: hypothetical protein B7C55_12130 [Actinomycetales bacterium mxb001]|nr:MAG: hypothetical protein B7C55_12130 [Actinomycetales bacterium mxb001]